MHENILVPTDGSDHAERGIDHGLEVASRYDATLHLLSVTDETIYGKAPGLSSYELFLDEVAADAAKDLEGVVEEAEAQGVDATMAVLRGTPHDVILEYVDDHNIDLVIMGKRGAAGVDPPHMGSVTDRVVSECNVPVVPV